MYIETSAPRHAGELARIESPAFTADGHQRLTFWYNAHGSGIGDLKVYFEIKGILGSPVFVESKGNFVTLVFGSICKKRRIQMLNFTDQLFHFY